METVQWRETHIRPSVHMLRYSNDYDGDYHYNYVYDYAKMKKGEDLVLRI